jgi:hypothetical protein
MYDDEIALCEGFFETIVGTGNVNAGISRLMLLVIAFIVIFGTGFWLLWPK